MIQRIYQKFCRLFQSRTPSMIAGIGGHFSADATFPPQGSLRGAAGRGSRNGGMTPYQIAELEKLSPIFKRERAGVLKAVEHAEQVKAQVLQDTNPR